MTEQLRQSLSAAIDGEADAFELRRVLDELDRDEELRATWERYHLIGSVLRGERTARSRSAAQVLADRVPLAVRDSTAAATGAPASDPASSAAKLPAAASGRRRATVGLGLAAGLVLAVTVAYQAYDGGAGPADVPIPIAGVESAPAAVGPGWVPEAPALRSREYALAARPVQDRRAREASAADVRRAQAYMLQHAQQQGLEQRGIMSLVKMATYEAP